MVRTWLFRFTLTGAPFVGLLFTLLIWSLFIVNLKVLQPFELLASDLVSACMGHEQLGRWPWPFTV